MGNVQKNTAETCHLLTSNVTLKKNKKQKKNNPRRNDDCVIMNK